MPRERWISAAELIRSWRFKVMPDRLAILNAVWEKEMGHLSRHWKLQGVRRNTIYVSPRSPSAAMELRMRTPGIVRSLNKYFKTAWIKEIRAEVPKRENGQGEE